MPEDPEEIPPLDEEWVQAAKHREESAEVRADRYARINSGFQQVQSGETSWHLLCGGHAGLDRPRLRADRDD